MWPRKSTEPKATPAPAGLHRKPEPDLYTVLLVIALLAILVGILFLYLESSLYHFEYQGAPSAPVVSTQQKDAGGQWLVASGQWSAASSSFVIRHSSFSSFISEHGCSHSKTC